MGYAGLIADNIVSMDVVVADGSQITVSASSYPDLYFGMRGAGQNYGIVTNFVLKIFDYPRGPSTYLATYIYSGDKLEAFFKQSNKLLGNGKLEKNANYYALFVSNPALSPKVSLIDQVMTILIETATHPVPILLLRYRRRGHAISRFLLETRPNISHQFHTAL